MLKLTKLRKIGTSMFMAFCLSSTDVRADDVNMDDGPLINLRMENAPLELVIPAIVQPTNMNVVVDSKVSGKTTLKLKDVPWRQGLDLILKTNELDMREIGNTLVIAPKTTISKNFDQGVTKTYRLSYAKAEKISAIITPLLGKQTAGEINVQIEPRLNALIVSAPVDMFPRIEELLEKVDRPVPQVMIDVKIVEVSSNFNNTLGFDWGWGTGGTAPNAVANPGAGSFLQFTEYARVLDNESQYNSPGQPTGMNLFNFGDFFRTNFFFNAVFSAITQTSESRILSSPRVIAMNGVPSNLKIGRELVFNSGGVEQGTDSREAGTEMQITPQINNQGFIVLEIELTKSTVALNTNGLPTLDSTNVVTTLQVQDGEEILVGGLVEEEESRSVQKIPFLSNLPFLKHIFTKNSYAPKSKEIVILITPKIVKQNIAATDFGELVADSSRIPPTDSMNPRPSQPTPPPMNDIFPGNDFGDDFGDEFGGL